MEEKDNFTIPPELREQELKKVQQTSIFLRFIEERTYEEQKLLFAEIDNILENGMPRLEYIEPVFKGCKAGWTDYKQIAKLCFAEALMNFMEEVDERTKDLYLNDDLNEAYATALQGISRYVHGVSNEFPRDAVRCLFLLTDGDIDPHRQGMIMAWLVLHSFSFCKTDEQRTEIERLIKECM